MDFDRIPYHVFLEILKYLPFRELIRISRVSRCFFRMSAVALPEIKYLKLYDEPCLIWEDQPGSVDEQFQRRLLRRSSYLQMLSSFSSPKLTELEITAFTINDEIFGNLLRNNWNLKKLTLEGRVDISVHPRDFVSENLETLHLNYPNDRFIRSLSHRCPNLKRLEIVIYNSIAAAMDELISSSQIHSLIIYSPSDFPHSDLAHFWCQASMRLLVLNCSDPKVNDDILLKITSSFPLLEVLYLRFLDVTDRGVGVLAKLRHLRKVGLDYNVVGNSIDMGIQRLAEVGRLQVAHFDFLGIEPLTLMKLIRFCPDLRFLCVRKVNAQTPETAATCLRSMSGLSRVDLTIRTDIDRAVWQSVQVKTALKDLKESDGNSIVFETDDSGHVSFPYLKLSSLFYSLNG